MLAFDETKPRFFISVFDLVRIMTIIIKPILLLWHIMLSDHSSFTSVRSTIDIIQLKLVNLHRHEFVCVIFSEEIEAARHLCVGTNTKDGIICAHSFVMYNQS